MNIAAIFSSSFGMTLFLISPTKFKGVCTGDFVFRQERLISDLWIIPQQASVSIHCVSDVA